MRSMTHSSQPACIADRADVFFLHFFLSYLATLYSMRRWSWPT